MRLSRPRFLPVDEERVPSTTVSRAVSESSTRMLSHRSEELRTGINKSTVLEKQLSSPTR